MCKRFKKCEICGLLFERNDDLLDLIADEPAICSQCQNIIELKDIIEESSKQHFMDIKCSEIVKRNYRVVGGENNSIKSYVLGDHFKSYEISGRSEQTNALIGKIIDIRRYLHLRIEPQFQILDSIYKNKNIFWKEGGNLSYYVSDSSLQFVVIKLKELLSGEKLKYSVQKIRKTIENQNKEIFEDQTIIEKSTFKNSGDIERVTFPKFPISDFLKKLDYTLECYKTEIKALCTLRDKVYAHFDKLKTDELMIEINYAALKRIFAFVKTVYDGFLYSIAPDKFTNLVVETNIWFENMDQIVEKYQKDFLKS